MRIISGKAGGIRLQVPEGDAVRPTEDRVKEALFASLGSLQNQTVFDLFSGSGALGLEALSRGAGEVILVEKNPRHIQFIEKNLAAVCKAMGADCGKARIIQSDVRQVPERFTELSGQVDLVLADPPYNPPPGSFGGRELLLYPEFADWCGKHCLFLLEHEKGSSLPWYPQSPWKLERQKNFGRRTISYLRPVSEA
ncbi:MAG: RsmD family RNA methyltransferase [Lentisphaeria bacterium]